MNKKTIISLLQLIALCVIPEGLILMLLSIARIYGSIVPILLLLIALVLLIALNARFAYIKLYTKYNLPMSKLSYIRFSFIIVQFLFYLISIFFISYKKVDPIYLPDLSPFSQYKYLLCCIVSIIVILLMLTRYFYNSDLLGSIPSFNLQEEMRKILYIWNENIFGIVCSTLMDKLYSSKTLLFIYLFSHFIIFYIFRIILLIFFINFIWFNGDLRLILFAVPFSFIIWILAFFDFYFQIFFKNHCNYLRSILSVTQIDPVLASFGTVYTSLNNINFNLTSYGYNEGYSLEDLPVLINEWHIAAYLSVYITKYNHFLIFIRRILFCIQLMNVFTLVYFFFVKPYLNIESTLFAFFRGISFQRGSGVISSYYGTEATRLRSKTGKAYLNHETEGVQSGSHPALIDREDRNIDDPRQVRYRGQLTHGTGSPENPSVPLHPDKDLQGQNKPQYFIPAKRCEYYSEDLFNPIEIPGSKKYLAASPACENLIKHQVQEETT